MKKVLLFAALLGSAISASAQGFEARLAECFNSSLGWIPVNAAALGQTIVPAPVSIQLYAMFNGVTPTPVACDASGNIGGGTSGFPITLGTTSIASGSITLAVSGLTVDGVTPTFLATVDTTSSIQTQLNGKQASLGFTPAHSGANSDITSLASLSTPLSVAQGGTGSATGSTRIANSFCGGTATSSTTLSPWGFGGGSVNCTSTSSRSNGMVMTQSGTMSNLTVRCANTGVNSSSGVFTINETHSGSTAFSATALTVTYGTTTVDTAVQDTTHTATYVAGDVITVRFTTQASETLGNCNISFNY